LEKLKQHPEPEARFMRASSGKVPAYNVQIAVDDQHALIVTQRERRSHRQSQSATNGGSSASGGE
jgi:hypothetical protein